MIKKFALLFAILSLTSIPSYAGTYAIDTDHSTVSFKIRHLVSRVQGNFNTFEGTFKYDPADTSSWSVDATIQADSIDTNVAERDKHLRSADFFDVEKFPTLSFKSTKVTDATAESAKLHGLLTLHGVEKEVILDLEILGEAADPWGNKLASFSASTKINRKDFGLSWNEALETGGVLVGDEVKITLDIAGLLQ